MDLLDVDLRDTLPGPAALAVVHEAAEAILKESRRLPGPAEAMLYVSHIALPLLVTGYKISRDTSGRELGDEWLGRVFEGFARILGEETGEAFRIKIERVEEGPDEG
jgi:hypothetical protein